jgi:chromosome segregation ATPase
MDIPALLETGGPLVGFTVTACFFLKAYIGILRELYSGIIETTDATLRIARDQLVQMQKREQDFRSQKPRLEALLRAKDVEAQDLRSQIAELKARLRAEDKDAQISIPHQRSSLSDVTKDLPNSMPK